MRYFFSLFVLVFFGLALNAQYPSVVYDYEYNQFNQGDLLPSETYFNISGQVPADVSKVEVVIFKANKEKPVYMTEWTRSTGNQNTSLSIPVKYKLRSNAIYDIEIGFYRLTEKSDKKRIQQQIFTSLDGYVDGIVSVNSRKISFNKNTGTIMNDLYSIVDKSLVYYDPVTQFDFPGFSDIVRYKIDQVNDTKLSAADVNILKKEDDKKTEAKRKYAQKLIGELKTLLHNETSPYVMQDAYVLAERRKVSDVETEKSSGALTLQAGYGAVYVDGDLDDFNYFRGMYAGIVLPLGKPAFAPAILRNASISAGVFIKNFEDEDTGQETSGPIVGRPLYAALGYKFLKFVKLNVGATFLEDRSVDGLSLDVRNVKVRPFVGLSAQFKISGKLD